MTTVVREVEGPPRGHQNPGAAACFPDELGAFPRHFERAVAGHDLSVRTARRIPLEDLADPVIWIANKAVQ